VKRQFAVVTIDNDTVGVLCTVPHIFRIAEFPDMLYVYCFCNSSAIAAAADGEIFENLLYWVKFTNFHLNNKYRY
jgi:hypothetical protein